MHIVINRNKNFGKPTYRRYETLQVSKTFNSETYYDILQVFIEEDGIKLHYVAFHPSVLSLKSQDLWEIWIASLNQVMFDSSNLDKIHNFLPIKNKRSLIS